MSRPAKSDAGNTAKSTRTAPEASRLLPLVAVPRAWLITLTVVMVVPWLIAGGFYLRGSKNTLPLPTPSADSGPTTTAATGPWGHLHLTPIVVSPPLEYIAADWGQNGAANAVDEWYFPDTTVEILEAFLLSTGLSPEEVARLRSAARRDPPNRGLIVTPDPPMVRTMDSQIRGRLYGQLARSSLNSNQANSFRFFGSSTEAWLGGSLISPRTRQLIEPMIYRTGDFLNFADVRSIRSLVGDVEELRRLAKVLLRQSTVLVRLLVDDASEVKGLAEYWGRGGRRTDLRPLLESIAGAGPDRSIDIVHLLPVFAREHLYRYPKISTADLNRPLLANCLWTALNFFSAKPDDRFLDVTTALSSLREDYYVVQRDFELGDIVAFLDEEGDLFHVAVYLADDLVFSKNGMSPVAAWTIETIDRLKAYYSGRSANPRLIYHRRNDF